MLQKVDIARGYINILRDVENLTLKAHAHFDKSPHAALEPYLAMQNVADKVRAAQPAAEDAAPHLIDFVDGKARTLWKHMKAAFAVDFENLLERIHWPAKDVTLPESLEQDWLRSIDKLIELQQPEFWSMEIANLEPTYEEQPIVLLPLEVMMKPLELRFRYHFEGDRPTNKIDKVRQSLIPGELFH